MYCGKQNAFDLAHLRNNFSPSHRMGEGRGEISPNKFAHCTPEP